MTEQRVERSQKRRKKSDKKLEFEVGKVFGPEAAKDEDLSVDVEAGRYKAVHGEGGDRSK